MINVTGVRELIPENDLQELWAIYGRYEAISDYLTNAVSPTADDVKAMMGIK